MNMQPMSNVQAPPACKTMEDTGLTPVTMRDILLKTMFRMNLETVTDLERVLAVPSRAVQDLVDAARSGDPVNRPVIARESLRATR